MPRFEDTSFYFSNHSKIMLKLVKATKTSADKFNKKSLQNALLIKKNVLKFQPFFQKSLLDF